MWTNICNRIFDFINKSLKEFHYLNFLMKKKLVFLKIYPGREFGRSRCGKRLFKLLSKSSAISSKSIRPWKTGKNCWRSCRSLLRAVVLSGIFTTCIIWARSSTGNWAKNCRLSVSSSRLLKRPPTAPFWILGKTVATSLRTDWATASQLKWKIE